MCSEHFKNVSFLILSEINISVFVFLKSVKLNQG